MKTDPINAESKKFLLARLRLAQTVLEDSDRLEGCSGYNFDSDTWWLHPRHEHEALVIYLLLTCFDRLGQDKKFTTLPDWLKSNKSQHANERSNVLDHLPAGVTPLEVACKLANEYQSRYGVRNAFYQGIDNLSEEGRKRLFSSVSISFNPEYGKHGPNVSTPSYPIEDMESERKLQLKYLFNKRNRFTHSLEQYHRTSTPLFSDTKTTGGSSWTAWIRDDKVTYLGCHQEHTPSQTGGVYAYTTSDWPFVLFEVLYDAIGHPFERTSIKLKFHVQFFSKAEPNIVGSYPVVAHQDLKDFRSLAKKFWADRNNDQRPTEL